MANNRVDDTLATVAEGLARAKAALPDAEELVKILNDAGEDSSEVQALIIETKTRIANWERTLQRRGVSVPIIETDSE